MALEQVRALLEGRLEAKPDQFGVLRFPLIAATDPAYQAMKVRHHPLILGLEPDTLPLATAISLLPAGEIAERFGSYEAAVRAGIEAKNGAVLLYGLQTAAIRDRDAGAALALTRAANEMKIFFQYLPGLVGLIPAEVADAALMELTAEWNPNRALLVWGLLEDHKPWSPELSGRVLASVSDSGTAAKNGFWSWRGNGVADNLHVSLVPQAIEVLKPLAKTEPNAKRWLTRLKRRAAS